MNRHLLWSIFRSMRRSRKAN